MAGGAHRIACCLCPYCDGPPPNAFTLVLSDFSLCDCTNSDADPYGDQCSRKWLTAPDVGPNGTWSLPLGAVESGYCKYEKLLECTATVRIYTDIDCDDGNPYHDLELNRYQLRIWISDGQIWVNARYYHTDDPANDVARVIWRSVADATPCGGGVYASGMVCWVPEPALGLCRESPWYDGFSGGTATVTPDFS